MNWGKSIVFIFVLFAGFIGTMIYQMCRQQVDLVRDDYYQTELAYQQEIDRETNARLNTAIAMTYRAEAQQLALALPASLRKGQIHFYRPADRQLDFSISVPVVHDSLQLISTANLARGHWRVQLTWSDGRQDYYTEQELFL